MPPQRRNDSLDDPQHLRINSNDEADDNALLRHRQLPEIDNSFLFSNRNNKHVVDASNLMPKVPAAHVPLGAVPVSLNGVVGHDYNTLHTQRIHLRDCTSTPTPPPLSQQEPPSSSLAPSSRSKQKKAVQFSSNVTVREVPRVSSYMKGQSESLWITEEEFLQIRKKRQRTIDRLRWGYSIPIDDTEHTDIGLYTYTEQLRKDARVQYARNVVLDEQFYHKYELAEDGGVQQRQTPPHPLEIEYAIADAYYEATCETQQEAVDRGLWLQEDMVYLYNNEDCDDDLDANEVTTFNKLQIQPMLRKPANMKLFLIKISPAQLASEALPLDMEVSPMEIKDESTSHKKCQASCLPRKLRRHWNLKLTL